MSKKVKVCFVGLYTYQLFNPDFKGIFGGSEVRASIIMKELAKDDQFEIVNVVNADPGVVEGTFDGVRVVKHSYYKHDYHGEGSKQQPILKRILPKTSGYYAYKLQLLLSIALKKITDKAAFSLLRRGVYGKGCEYIPQKKIDIYDKMDADVYCIFGVHQESYELVSYCKSNTKMCVLFLGSDSDIDTNYSPKNTSINNYGYRNDLNYYALTGSSVIIAQTQYQHELLETTFKLKSTVIRNPIDINSKFQEYQDELPKNFVLWVGKSHHVKAPEKFIEIAKRLPGLNFVMVMNVWDAGLHQSVLDELPANITYIEQVPFARIESLFKQAYVFVNTSHFEGMPNTFLQALKHGVPVLSLNSDPDSMLTHGGCGAVSGGDLDHLLHILKKVTSSQEMRDLMSQKAKEYVKANHELQDVIRAVKNVIGDTL